MAESKSSVASSAAHASSSNSVIHYNLEFLHTISGAGRVLPSSSKWNSIELEFKPLFPQSSNLYDSLPSKYSKSYDYDLVITDRKHFKTCLYTCVLVIAFIIVGLVLFLHFLPHKLHHHKPSKNLTLALNQALTFFDAQKSGWYPENSPVKFRGNSGMQDGNTGMQDRNTSGINADLVGGFYDSGKNVKFTFPTAYTVTLLSWTVIEYHEKYAEIGELEHVKDIIKWGSDYLLKVFVPPNSTSTAILYSQVGSTYSDTKENNDLNCWQRPEDMNYSRPVFGCESTASDLAGEIIAALSATSIVFKEEKGYSRELIKAAEILFEDATKEDSSLKQGAYSDNDTCGGEARMFYNSTGYIDELAWAGTWLFFATGNVSYLAYAADKFRTAEADEGIFDKGTFYWNNKLTANAVLLTRLRFFRDVGSPFEDALVSSSYITEILMCSYLSNQIFEKTKGGLILLRPNFNGHLQFAATTSFLSKLYSNYLDLLRISSVSCGDRSYSLEMLRAFSTSQVNYILGDNPMKTSYMVGFGDKYPTQVHHRSASIPWDGKYYSCSDGDKWLYSKRPNPNLLVGGMVAGPDKYDKFFDERDKPWFTEPNIASNAGFVAALIALHDPPHDSLNLGGLSFGIDQMGMFEKIHD